MEDAIVPIPMDDLVRDLASGALSGLTFVQGEGRLDGLGAFADVASRLRRKGLAVSYCSSVAGAYAAVHDALEDLGQALARDVAERKAVDKPADVERRLEEGVDPRALAAVMSLSSRSVGSDRDQALTELRDWLAGRTASPSLALGQGAKLDTVHSRTSVLRALAAMGDACGSTARTVVFLDGFDERGLAASRAVSVGASSTLSEALHAAKGRLSIVVHATPEAKARLMAWTPSLKGMGSARIPSVPLDPRANASAVASFDPEDDPFGHSAEVTACVSFRGSVDHGTAQFGRWHEVGIVESTFDGRESQVRMRLFVELDADVEAQVWSNWFEGYRTSITMSGRVVETLRNRECVDYAIEVLAFECGLGRKRVVSAPFGTGRSAAVTVGA